MNSQKININPQHIFKKTKQSYKPLSQQSQQSKYKSRSNVTSSHNIIYIVGGVFLILIIIYVFNILIKTDDDNDNTKSNQLIETPVNNKEVFHIERNKEVTPTDNFFSSVQAKDACKALNSDLATYDQLVQSAENGMSLCMYGWIKGSDNPLDNNIQNYFINNKKTTCKQNIATSAPYSDKETYEIYKGGLNENNIGVNCYGVKPNMPEDHQATLLANNTAQQDAIDAELKTAQDFAKLVKLQHILPFNDTEWSQQRGND